MSKIKQSSILSDEDWSILLPTEEIILGKTKIGISPLDITSFSRLTAKVVQAAQKIKNIKNIKSFIKTPEGFEKIVKIVVLDSPEIISILTGIPEVDVVRLPITKCIEITAAAWEINLKDQGSLEKNLLSLVGMVDQLTAGGMSEILKPKSNQADSEKESSSLLKKDIPGVK